MPATMAVRENGYVLYFVFAAPLTTQELIDAMIQDGQYRDSVPFKVHALANFSQTDIPPMAVRSRLSPSLIHPRRGHFVAVGTKGVIRAFAEMVIKISGNDRFKFFDTEDEGWAYLRDVIAQEEQKRTG